MSLECQITSQTELASDGKQRPIRGTENQPGHLACRHFGLWPNLGLQVELKAGTAAIKGSNG